METPPAAAALHPVAPRTPAVAVPALLVPVRAVSPALRVHPHAAVVPAHRRVAQARAAQRASARRSSVTRSLARRSLAQAAQVPAEAAAPNCPSANAAHRAAPTAPAKPSQTSAANTASATMLARNAPVDHYEFYDHDGVRLQKLLAQAGVASRRVCEEMITEGRVTVNGEVVTELGVRVDPSKVTVQVDGMTVQTNDKLVYMAFNKPAGVVSTMEDPEGRPCISDFLRSSMSERVFHVGRLDVETEGLLLLTNDGELANRLTHPSYEVPKTYMVQVPGPMEPGVGAAMKKGIRLEDGVTRVDEFKLVDSTPGHVLVEVTIHSGKNRIVRRLFDAVGYPVERLVRVEMGPIRIGSQKQGTVRNLSKVEIGHLLASVDM